MEVRLAVGVGLGSGGANGVGTGGKATEKEAVARFFQAGQGRPPHKRQHPTPAHSLDHSAALAT